MKTVFAIILAAAVLFAAVSTTHSETTSTASVTTTTESLLRAMVAPTVEIIETEVFIYDTTAQGIGALRAIELGQFSVGSVVIANQGYQIGAMTAQGPSVEDAYCNGKTCLASGIWAEFRNSVINEYRLNGINAVDKDGRLLVEPEVAGRLLGYILDYNGRGRPGVICLKGYQIEAAHYEHNNHWVLLKNKTGQFVKVKPIVMIDASIEGDLARHLGASYRYGFSEQIYGGNNGLPPEPAEEDKSTWIQKASILLTLQVYDKVAPNLAGLVSSDYDPTLYETYVPWQSEENRVAFAKSWSMSHIVPSNKRELNEAWSDYSLDCQLPYKYIFGIDENPLIREQLRGKMVQTVVDKVRYLQENGYANLAIANIPERIYLREGIRVVGLTTYTAEDIEKGAQKETIAFGLYSKYDVHLAVEQDHSGALVHIPMGTIISAELPDLLIPGPISTDHRAYNSAVRMEPLRANYGGAAGTIAAIALTKGFSPAEVPYEAVRKELLRLGYRLQL